MDIDVGDEGGFAPNGLDPHKALNYLKHAIQSTKKYKIGRDVFFGIDVAAGSFYSDNQYKISESALHLNSVELLNYYKDLLRQNEIIYLEDPFYESNYQAWQRITKELGNRLLVSGDDLVVTNPELLQSAIKNNYCNTVIVKPNQVGTLTETFDFIRKAQDNHLTVCISHRSGDTAEDTFIADLAVAVGADFIKSGAPARGERVAKYNRLLEIFHSVN
jgi:enolase